MNKYNIFTLFSLLFTKIKVFVSERDSPTEKIPLITAFLRDKIYCKADGVISQTSESKVFIEGNTGNNNVVAIPNPIKKVTKLHTGEKKNVILNVGRLVHKKGQKYLVDAFSKLKNKNWRLVFVGDGPLKKDLVQQVHELGLTDRVEFRGFEKDVATWYKSSKVFAFPSILEGFPNALAEAMSYGMACVSFDCKTGPRDIINDGVNGYLVEEGNVEVLVSRLDELMGDDSLIHQFSEKAFGINKRLNETIICDSYLKFCLNE